MRSACSKAVFPILLVMLVTGAVCLMPTPASAYHLMLDPIDTGSSEYWYTWTYYGNQYGPTIHGYIAPGYTMLFDSSIHMSMEYSMDLHTIYRALPEVPYQTWSYFDAFSFKGGYLQDWDYDLLDHQTVVVKMPGLTTGGYDLYVGVNLKQYGDHNPNPNLTMGQTFSVAAGNIPGIQGLKVSTTPITFAPDSGSGMAGTWYNGPASVNAFFTGTPVPEPSSLLALASGLAAAGLTVRRRRR